MICRIADLIVDVPAAGGMASRCAEYLTSTDAPADIVISADLYRREKYPTLSEVSSHIAGYYVSGNRFFGLPANKRV